MREKMNKKIKHVQHPWHELSPGENIPEEVTAFIEVPKSSILKYELDKESGHIKLDRVLYSAVHYPGDYGFIPQTLSEDNDPLDIIIISNYPVAPGVIVKAKPIGVMFMVDNNEKDEKIIAVHSTDPRMDKRMDIKDFSDHVILEIRHFFETYKELQGKKSTIMGIKGRKEAQKEILRALKRYKETYKE
jgi:inorganic pyrophosphatase